MASVAYECRSASGEPETRLASFDPTAVQTASEVHDTPLRTAIVGLAGFGVYCRDQVVPFQRSANVTIGPAVPMDVWVDPTAVQFVGEVHDTPTRMA